ncbi:MAG TPA: HEAT repeat domain-containing protein, partial [Planctomycetota bacterium]|nr:HEAT repeat domain-containing protein [Planctomycetota bacterium]
EVRRDGQWTPLPAGMIASARLEDEVLGEWRGLKADVAKDDDDGRVALAEWGVEQGLYQEALAQLDEVLEADSDHAGARALLAAEDLPIGLPAAVDPLDFAASAPPALRELAVSKVVEQTQAAAEDPAAAEANAALRADLDRRLLERQPGQRAAAALTLRRLAAGAEPPVSGFSEAELAELLRRAVRDVSPEVRRQSALALRDAQEEGLLLPLFKALGSRSSAVRTHAAQAMAAMGHARAVEPLVVRLLTLQPSGGEGFSAPRSNIFVGRQIAFVQGFDVEVAQNAAIGNPEIGTLQEGASLDVSVLGVSGGGGGGGYGYVQEGEALCLALEQLTGARPGRTKADWQRWWNEHRAEWVSQGDSGG